MPALEVRAWEGAEAPSEDRRQGPTGTRAGTADGDRGSGDLAGGVDGLALAVFRRREGAEVRERPAAGARQEREVQLRRSSRPTSRRPDRRR